MIPKYVAEYRPRATVHDEQRGDLVPTLVPSEGPPELDQVPFGFGVTTWYLTDERLIQQTEVGDGFNFQYIPLEKISSVEYGTKLNLPALILGAIAALIGLSGVLSDASDAGVLFLLAGAACIGYAYYRRRQVLAVSASGSASFSLTISSGDQVDEFLWYIHAEQQKQSEPVLRH
ncbi:hypothetical protein [Natrinema versiforme]|uniref:Uncharacterized protein n=1 Tax=Natrinema versiforme JCM 10478 TaxID=1227496 RepID=L9XTT6_9EURY|nr:hypothetical protein [Natrinema versiforme]ELY65219.1 hypothetical protein C489_15602 [Natrinema versiforme JCM 10478]